MGLLPVESSQCSRPVSLQRQYIIILGLLLFFITVFPVAGSEGRDEIRTQFLVQHMGLQDPVEAGKCTQAEGSGDRSEMGESIKIQQKWGFSLLSFWVLGSCCLLLSASFPFTLILNHRNDELKKCHVIWSTLYCIYRKQIICSLRIVETEYDELIWRKCRLGVTEKLVFYTSVTS